MTSLFFLELLFRHLMRFDDLPIAGVVEFQREKKSRFQLARRSPITRRVHDRRSCVGPFAQLHNVPFWCAMARVKMLWQMAFAETAPTADPLFHPPVNPPLPIYRHVADKKRSTETSYDARASDCN